MKTTPFTNAALLAAALTLLPLAGPNGPGTAAARDMTQVVNAGIRPGWREAGGTHIAGLHLQLADGWKTYWRAPGDGGFPPRFDWTGSENLRDLTIHWPRPVAFEQLGVRSIGYIGEVVLPLEFALIDPNAPARLSGTVEIGVCETVCIPVRLALNAELPAQGGSDAAIRAALAERPQAARALGLTAIDCTAAAIADGLELTVRMTMPRLGSEEVVVIEAGDEAIWVSSASVQRNGATLTARADMVDPSGAPFALDRSGLRITVLGDSAAADQRGC